MAFLDETGLAELWELIKAEDAKLAAADVKIATGSYTGTGTYGESNPNSLTFDFEPKVILFAAFGTSTYFYADVPFIRGSSFARTVYYVSNDDLHGRGVQLTWDGNTVSWYSDSSDSNWAAKYQLNVSGQVYRYVAIG